MISLEKKNKEIYGFPCSLRTKNEIYGAEFLHGYCHIFAYTLAKRKGYPILLRKYTRKPGFVHAWCMDGDAFLDIRGKTKNWRLFWSEFEDFDDFDPEDDAFTLVEFKNPKVFLQSFDENCIHL